VKSDTYFDATGQLIVGIAVCYNFPSCLPRHPKVQTAGCDKKGSQGWHFFPGDL